MRSPRCITESHRRSLFAVQAPAQKLLFSATLTYDPEVLKTMQLVLPVLFTSAEGDQGLPGTPLLLA